MGGNFCTSDDGKKRCSVVRQLQPSTCREVRQHWPHLPYDGLLVGVIERHEELSVFPNSAHKVSHKDIEAVRRGWGDPGIQSIIWLIFWLRGERKKEKIIPAPLRTTERWSRILRIMQVLSLKISALFSSLQLKVSATWAKVTCLHSHTALMLTSLGLDFPILVSHHRFSLPHEISVIKITNYKRRHCLKKLHQN